MSKLSGEEIQKRWTSWVSNALLSPKTVQDDAYSLKDGLRSVHWRIYLGILPTPHSSAAPFNGWQLAVANHRDEWHRLQKLYLRSPDGSGISDGPPDDTVSDIVPTLPVNGVLGSDPRLADATTSNPLSLDSSNPWKQWFADLELRKMLWQDVERTMPDVDYFRLVKVQRTLVNILHVWSRMNEGVGYRQGMHELLAFVVMAVDSDALPAGHARDASLDMMHLVLDESFVEHDAWSLFSALMKAAGAFYDATPSVPLPSTRAHMSGIGSERDKVTLVQPVIARCIYIFDTLLRRIDEELFKKLESLQIEPQIWGIRLLCGREFPMVSVLQLWDVLFAEDPSLRLIDQICMAMLLRIRTRLLIADYSTALQLLLRYPSEVVPDTLVLAKQALQLRDQATVTTAATIHHENVVTGLGELADALPSLKEGQRQKGLSAHRRAESAAANVRRSAPSLLAHGGGLVNDLAHNVFERAEAMGLNKALGDLKRNVEQYQASLSAPASSQNPKHMPVQSTSKTNTMLSSIVSLATDILERGANEDQARVTTALQALRHVASVLNGATSDIESSFSAALQPSFTPSSSAGSAASSHSTDSSPPTFALPSTGLPRPSPVLYLSTRNDRPLSGLTRSTYAPRSTLTAASSPKLTPMGESFVERPQEGAQKSVPDPLRTA